jgi:hypothetical protein
MDYNSTYWNQRYTKRADQVPVFLANHVDLIVTTGECRVRVWGPGSSVGVWPGVKSGCGARCRVRVWGPVSSVGVGPGVVVESGVGGVEAVVWGVQGWPRVGCAA